MPSPKYDQWKLSTPWDDEDDDHELEECRGCRNLFENLYDGLCGSCELDAAEDILLNSDE